MKGSILTILLFLAQISLAQLIIRPIIRNQVHINSRQAGTVHALEIDPASLPFWEDFSSTTGSPDSIRIWGTDTASQWNYELSKDVFVNATLAISPPSYRVATFDGWDANGGFHEKTDPWADQLVSTTIDLLGKRDVVLSFYWQAGGNTELPEEEDSLRLQFYDPEIEDGTWITDWVINGKDITDGKDSIFTQEARPIAMRYLTQEFKFRFQSFGNKDGPFDTWHLDYIYVNENRADDNYYYDDISLNQAPSSLFEPFHSIPTYQLAGNTDHYSRPFSIGASALEEPDRANAGVPAEYILEIDELVSMTSIDSFDLGDQPVIPVNQNPFSLTSSLHVESRNLDFSSLPLLDSMVIQTQVYFFNNIDRLFDHNADQINDTIQTQYLLHNYYAFDDGTAEYAAGINSNGGQVAIQFWLERPDTLTHIDIYFPNIDPPSAGKALTLNVFKNLKGSPPIRSQPIIIENGNSINEFTRYTFQTAVLLSDTFFIGYQQRINEYIGIGFDRSNPNVGGYLFENKTGQWEQNDRLKGSLMMRPVFSSSDSPVTGVEEVEKLKAYPNPTKEWLTINGTYHSMTLSDLTGRILLQEKSKITHDLTSLKQGLYLLTIHRKEGDQTLKIMKQ